MIWKSGCLQNWVNPITVSSLRRRHCNRQGKRGQYAHARAHGHARTLPVTVSPPQRRNCDWVYSILETTTLPNHDQANPDPVICLPLGLLVSTTSQMSLLNTDLLKISLQHNIFVNNNNNSLMYQLYPVLWDIGSAMVRLRSLPHTLSWNCLTKSK